jgi:hypothetical protein
MRRTGIRLLAVLVVALAGLTAAWWRATDAMLSRYQAFAAAAAAQGMSVTQSAVARGGWPYAVELRVRNFAVRAVAKDAPGVASWQGERLLVRIAAWQPALVRIEPEGRQVVRIGGGPDVAFTGERIQATTPVRAPGSTVALVARNLAFSGRLAGMTIGLLDGQAVDGAPAGLDVSLAAEAIRLPPGARTPLGDRIASASLSGTIRGTLKLDDATNLADSAAAWRDHEGQIRVQRFAVGWGPLGATGSATLSLDAALQPAAEGTVRLVGYDSALAALAHGGAITASAEQAGRAVLGLLAGTPAGGGPQSVSVPLTLSDGVVRLGLLPVGRVSKVYWPQG